MQYKVDNILIWQYIKLNIHNGNYHVILTGYIIKDLFNIIFSEQNY